MKFSILSRNDIGTLKEIGIKLKAGTKWEQTLGDLMLEYAKDRIPIPSKEDKKMFPVDEALAH
jgi:hypothetical protein